MNNFRRHLNSALRIGAVLLALGAGYYLVTTAHQRANPAGSAADDAKPRSAATDRTAIETGSPNPDAAEANTPIVGSPGTDTSPQSTPAADAPATQPSAEQLDLYLATSKSLVFTPPAELTGTPPANGTTPPKPTYLPTSKSAALPITLGDSEQPSQPPAATQPARQPKTERQAAKPQQLPAKPIYLPTSKSAALPIPLGDPTPPPASTKSRRRDTTPRDSGRDR